MDKITKENADFIFGREHRKTPANGMQTVKFTKPYPFKLINAVRPEHCRHLCFGPVSANEVSKEEILRWESTIRFFLDANYWCTLEIYPSHWEIIQKSTLVKYSRFILLVKLPLANTDNLNYNTCIVLEDKESIGVWTHELHNLRQRQYFTHDDEYFGDAYRKFDRSKFTANKFQKDSE